MVQFYKNGKNEPVIRYEIRGDKGDYIAQMKALVIAMSYLKEDNEVDNDARQTISLMLLDMMPCVSQLIH